MKKNFFLFSVLLLLLISCKTPGKSDQSIPEDTVNITANTPDVTVDSVRNSIDSSVEKVDELIKDL